MAMPDSRSCRKCGETFTLSGAAGRPPSYCDSCRAGRRSDDVAWRTVRMQVLAEEPWCAVAACSRPSSTVDHIVPIARGGARVDRRNLQGMCDHHNFSKGSKIGMAAPGNRTDPAHPRTAAGPRSVSCFGTPCPPHCAGGLGRWHV